ncbi:MAG: hypothetical protein ACLGJB_05175 [Blastocatellia bacterium]
MNNDSQQQQKELTNSFPTYKTTSEYLTGDPLATIYFHSLLNFSFNREACCEVGVNSRASSHNVNIQLAKKGSCERVSVPLPADFADPKKAYRLKINVNRPVRNGVYVFDPAPGSGALDGRYSFIEYGLDLEGPDMHNRWLQKRSESLWPRFSITNGLFYTYKVSVSKFALARGKVLGKSKNIVLVQAADIYLDMEGSIEFILNDEPPLLTLPLTRGEKYEIAITNSYRGAAGSSISPATPTDFDLSYLAIKKSDPAHKDKFNLTLTYDSGIRTPVTFGTCMIGDSGFCDPAPCLGLCFGRSLNLD